MNKKIHRIHHKLKVIKKERAEEKKRQIELNKLKREIRTLKRNYFRQVMKKKVLIHNIKRELRLSKIQYSKAQSKYVNAKSLESKDNKLISLKNARRMFISKKQDLFRLEKELRMLKEQTFDKIAAVVRGEIKLRLIYNKLRVNILQRKAKKYEMLKNKFSIGRKTLEQLKKTYGDSDKLNRVLKRVEKRYEHISDRLSKVKKMIIKLNKMKVTLINKMNGIEVKKYQQMKNKRGELKRVLNGLINDQYDLQIKEYCSNGNAQRIKYYLKLNKLQVKNIKLEKSQVTNALKAIEEKIRQRRNKSYII